MSIPNELAALIRQRVLAFQHERGREGRELLSCTALLASRAEELPPRLSSFLGVAIARCEGRRREGLELCRTAVAREPLEPENLLNLALVCLMLGRRRAALNAVDRGLLVVPGHEALLEMRANLGKRRAPLLAFLPRTHPVNVLVGKLRHDALSRLSSGRVWLEERLTSNRTSSRAATGT